MAKAKPIPDGYHSIQPYLIFKDSNAAIRFYTEAFGATEKMRMPNAEGRIAHAEIQIGNSVLMMADEAPPIDAFSSEHYGGSPVSLLLYTEDCDAIYSRALQAGAHSLREPADQSYGDRMAGVKDPFGYSWWLATPIAKADSPEAPEATAGAIR